MLRASNEDFIARAPGRSFSVAIPPLKLSCAEALARAQAVLLFEGYGRIGGATRKVPL